MPGFSTSGPNFDEARLDATVALIVSKIGDLDILLQQAPLSMPAGTATSALVMLGDPDAFDRSTPFIICVTGGGKNDALDLEATWREIRGPAVSPSSFRHTVHTNVAVYVYPDTLPQPDATWASIKAQAGQRERLRSRVCDFLRADVFETLAGVDMTLGSHEFSNSGDNLTMGKVASIRKGWMEKGFGGAFNVYGAVLNVVHVLN